MLTNFAFLILQASRFTQEQIADIESIVEPCQDDDDDDYDGLYLFIYLFFYLFIYLFIYLFVFAMKYFC